jgi:hypothetical protein
MRKFFPGLLKLVLMCAILVPPVLKGQTELVPVDHKIYPFLENLSLRGLIDYNSASIPISRGAVASYLKQIDSLRSELSPTERKILDDLEVEFSYDINKSTDKSFSLLSNLPGGLLNIFDDEKQKYLVSYTDENFSLFLDGIGSLSYRDFNTESFPNAHLSLGEIGPRLRGTLYNNVAFDVQVTEGQSLSGDQYARSVAAGYDPTLAASYKFIGDKYITAFNHGYLRYESDNHAVALTFGRDNFEMGDGYIDKLFISDNIPPFDFARLDLKYKFFKYSFFYGNLKGDSLGTPLTSKNIVGHRLDIELSPSFRFGIYESIILSNESISFTYLNPISVLQSANLSTGGSTDSKNNSLLGFDFEVRPHKNLAMQFTLLIDDLNFSTLGDKKDPSGNDNKFGYQAGLICSEPFGISDLTAKLEYTLLDPFVYSHRTISSSYTNWGIALGASLPPNSDEIALELDYYLTNRITLNFLYKHQRSGEGFLDANGNLTFDDRVPIIRNYGGDVNRGDLDFAYVNNLLMGARVNHDIFTLSTRIEPIRQYFLDISYSLQSVNKIYLSKTYMDQFLYVTASTDF